MRSLARACWEDVSTRNRKKRIYPQWLERKKGDNGVWIYRPRPEFTAWMIPDGSDNNLEYAVGRLESVVKSKLDSNLEMKIDRLRLAAFEVEAYQGEFDNLIKKQDHSLKKKINYLWRFDRLLIAEKCLYRQFESAKLEDSREEMFRISKELLLLYKRIERASKVHQSSRFFQDELHQARIKRNL